MPHKLYATFIRLPMLVRILMMALGMILLFGFVIHLIEPDQFPTVFEGIWWAIITTSTVGYGDYVPITIVGKLTAMLLILVGAGFLTSYFVTLATTAVSRQNAFEEGKISFKGEGHVIIVGWNERSREIINSLENLNQDVILIDETLDRIPYMSKNIHFIKGRANRDDILLKANIYQVSKVVITADQNLNELQADMNTIITLLAIKGLNPKAICIVEILTSEQIINATRAGADEIIETNALSSMVIQNSLKSKDFSCPLHHLLNRLGDQQLMFQPANHLVIGKNFKSVAEQFFDQNHILIGIKRGEDTHINPPHSLEIQLNDLLLIINE